MPIESFASQNCSIARTLSVLGERWTVLVLRELSLGNTRFDDIQRELGVATNILSARLATLVDEGIAERRRYSEHPALRVPLDREGLGSPADPARVPPVGRPIHGRAPGSAARDS